MTHPSRGLSLAPFRGLRPAVDDQRLGRLLCPPYDVIADEQRASLLAGDPDNAAAVIVPRGEHPYAAAADRLDAWATSGLWRVDPAPALYVYEMRTTEGIVTRGVLGAVELRDPADGVILPHENTMAGPVADRLALMTATETDLEPIYLVYEGGGATTELVAKVSDDDVVASASTSDGIRHRLWMIADPEVSRAVAADLTERRALIADGHHRYATYRALQAALTPQRGSGPWDRGLTLLVDTLQYGPQVHAIHRVLTTLPLEDAVAAAANVCDVASYPDVSIALAELDRVDGFGAVLSDGNGAVLVSAVSSASIASSRTDSEPDMVAALDVTVLHRILIGEVWKLPDIAGVVDYAHTVDEALSAARSAHGTAVLLRPTPVRAVAAVASAGARMPRKSTFFTPKPASGLVMRRFIDQH